MDNKFEEFQEMFKDMPMMFPPFGMPMFPMMPPMMMAQMFFSKMTPESIEEFLSKMMKGGDKSESKVMGIPKEILQRLLKIDATPEELEKLQKLLDFIFSMYETGKR